ncbi:hypothetical protein HPB48_015958 [Haemaphysalis longicornis]|uniref:TRAF1-6 MATH domain-containing protein n=1 Tax=Haemaphysalis longicornis TaxID=44386 RepID=A0A9J6FRI6_HAELO|nr:hypothetical protein HPB48_015958 [Haemaphysalis longicornis]
MCGHTFCQQCYESFVTPSECICPLDGDVCGRDDVTRKEYKVEQLLIRKVHCWNEANGCAVVLPASQIAEHVRHDCKHHVTCCPTCSADVLSRDMCAHLKSRCRTLVLHTAAEKPRGTNNHENLHLVALERQVEQRVRELDVRLAQLSLESSSHNDKLLEVCHNINYLKEAQEEQFGALAEKFERSSVQAIDRLDRNVAEIKALYTEKSEALMTALHSVLSSFPSNPRTHQWVLKGYAVLKAKALKYGWSLSMSEKVYLLRYLMSWGIIFHKDGDSVNLHLRIQLREGREDEFLEWPFTKKMKLSIIHPETRQQLHRVATPALSENNRECYWRPIKSSNTPVHFSCTEIELGDIERGGYLKRDQLLLRLEVLL